MSTHKQGYSTDTESSGPDVGPAGHRAIGFHHVKPINVKTATPDRKPQFAILTLNGLQLSTYMDADAFDAAETRLVKLKVSYLTFCRSEHEWSPIREYDALRNDSKILL